MAIRKNRGFLESLILSLLSHLPISFVFIVSSFLQLSRHAQTELQIPSVRSSVIQSNSILHQISSPIIPTPMDNKTIQNPSLGFLITIDSFRFQKLASWLYGFAAASRKASTFPISEPALKTEVDGDHRERLISREEMKSVMGKLGLLCEEQSEESLPLFGTMEGVSEVFEERPPCVAEVKEAFDVFDANGDGFVDVEELQRVLCVLGLKEGEKIENCRRMIQKFDENKDGRIDFHEFLKLMESVL